MIKFLIERPISVLMTFLACCIVGLVALPNLPISLLPDIPIPEITIQVSNESTSARELENTVVRPLRQQLNQLSNLTDIRTETRDGIGLIRLRFEYGTNAELAFMEANEKVDASMNYLPRTVDRPRVIKASATDIPVQYVNLMLVDDRDFLDLCAFAETVVKRRIEQLPEVSMVDVTGLVKKEVLIVPDKNKMEIAGIALSELENALNQNNVEPGGLIVRDGHYEYNIRFSSVVRTLDDVRNIFIRKNDRLYTFADLAEIQFAPASETGMALFENRRCVRLAIIKQADVNMDDLQRSLNQVIQSLKETHTWMDIQTTENQAELLDYTISNLKQNLILAFIFVWLISVVFMNDMRSPILIGISMIVAVIVSLLLFYLLDLSINVVSLTGLILASGNMIDNSIVVSDNITQYRQRGLSPPEACIKGTNEVMGPMLSSALSSIAVFAPLVFLSGIAGALFFDQALSVTIGMFVSYLTGIILLPVLFNQFNKKESKRSKPKGVDFPERLYHKGITWVFAHKALTTVVMLAVLPICACLFWLIPKEKMPDLHQQEIVVSLDWNENIHVAENARRTQDLLEFIRPHVVQQTGMVGQQQFLLDRKRPMTSSESELYVKVSDADQLPDLEQRIREYLNRQYPQALAGFEPAGTIFEKLFTTGEADLVVECYPSHRDLDLTAIQIQDVSRRIAQATGVAPEAVAFERQLNIQIDQEKLLYYGVSYNEVNQALRTAFRINRIATLRSYQQYLPVVLGGKQRSIEEILSTTLIRVSMNKDGSSNKLSLNRFVRVWESEDLKTIVAGKAGEYIPMTFAQVEDPDGLMRETQRALNHQTDWDIAFSGGIFASRKMLLEMMVILFISILLMYFILVAQFESFVQPLIILMEIPIDIAASLGLLMLAGHTLNLMSAIGMVVTCGIVINDSILKVDVMNQLRSEGFALMDAIHEAGRRRLNAILMTSFTSIVCMAPLLLTDDLGSNLEKPLALATIGGMIIGTPVSLFVVPLLYWWIYRKND